MIEPFRPDTKKPSELCRCFIEHRAFLITGFHTCYLLPRTSYHFNCPQHRRQEHYLLYAGGGFNRALARTSSDHDTRVLAPLLGPQWNIMIGRFALTSFLLRGTTDLRGIRVAQNDQIRKNKLYPSKFVHLDPSKLQKKFG